MSEAGKEHLSAEEVSIILYLGLLRKKKRENDNERTAQKILWGNVLVNPKFPIEGEMSMWT